MCRVIKKNEQTPKTSDVLVEQKSNHTGSNSSTRGFTSSKISNEPLMIPDDMQHQASYVGRESNFSTPTTSPYENTPMMEYEPAPMGSNHSSLWVSPDFILDSSKVYISISS